MKKFIYLLLFAVNIKSNLNAQKASMFNAKFYNVKEFSPNFQVGKGFNINDVYDNKLFCFKDESPKVKSVNGTNSGKVTQVGIYYTTTEKEFENLQNSSFSTDVSFLNLFSFGFKDELKVGSRRTENTERIVFKANVDFGNFTLATNPILNADASVLIKQKKFNIFIEKYGTHYISGYHKESSILVMLTKTNRVSERYSNSQTSFNIGTSVYKVGADMDITNNEVEKQRFEQDDFEISFKFNGPEFDVSNLKSTISSILANNSYNSRLKGRTKFDKIKEYLETFITDGVAKDLNDPNKGIKTQYYYTPFKLFGLEGVYWDEKKIETLTKINQAVLVCADKKVNIELALGMSGEIEDFSRYNLSLKQAFAKRFKGLRDSVKVLVNLYADDLESLRIIYEKCSNISCKIGTNCCGDAITDFPFTMELERRIVDMVVNLQKDIKNVSENYVTTIRRDSSSNNSPNPMMNKYRSSILGKWENQRGATYLFEKNGSLYFTVKDSSTLNRKWFIENRILFYQSSTNFFFPYYIVSLNSNKMKLKFLDRNIVQYLEFIRKDN